MSGTARVAATLKEVAEQSDDAIVSMVRDYTQNVDVILGDGGLLSANPKGLTIIVMSTLDPDSMNELGERVEAAAGVKLVAAAVSGGATGPRWARCRSWPQVPRTASRLRARISTR